jgi:hypothetical protein
MSEDLMLDKLLEITQYNRDNGIIDCEILADSKCPVTNRRIITFLLRRFPKGALQSQLNTHRSISKNSASSRAINKKKYVDNILLDPYVPLWTVDKPGMIGELIEDVDLVQHYTKIYLDKMHMDIKYVEKYFGEIHKQDSSCQLDHYVRLPIICTSSESNWNYFFDLRCGDSTKPEFRRIALEMQRLYKLSIHSTTNHHIPWIRDTEKDHSLKDKLTLSTARSAWISYANHQKLDSLDVARNTVEKLWSHKHYSCFDHCAKTSSDGILYSGWLEYRRFYE